ncbi:alpha/beta hydrolase [Alteromonas sp. KUL49]|uniref:alpha/beta hydrolase n=1 Tax=Alteromonas sp. KUL49 TaxID=2480798 RepID=UPI00102F1B9F|nr:alpha/beta hydrolase [Alteromonas sp. KUL49]TAP41361.1 alpha/beta hydrolase [Alteromonas sp. KUL49]GEA10432.1 hypothetical protein KUL49_08070 [Alteromonas sp. KUL49]
MDNHHDNKQHAAIASELLSTIAPSKEPKVCTVASESPTGLGEGAAEVLAYIHSLPPAYQFPPSMVRSHRHNPYEHQVEADVETHDKIIPAGDHTLDVRCYRPAIAHSESLPALVYFHGGGFVLGDIESYDALLKLVCDLSQIMVISVAYRLAPETPFPGAVEDVQSAMDWVFANHQALNIDPYRVVIGGDSAGANLSLTYCQLNKNSHTFQPCSQLLIYPSTLGNDRSASRTKYSEGLLLTAPLLAWFHDNYIDKDNENDPRFNCMKASSFGALPSAFVLTAGFDPLRDEGEMLVNAMIKDGVTVRHSCYTDMFHGFINFSVIPQARNAIEECAHILRTVTQTTLPTPKIRNEK